MQRIFVFLIAIVTVITATGVASAQVEVTYDFSTGEVILGQFSGEVGLKLFSAGSNFNPDIAVGTLADGSITDSTIPNNLGGDVLSGQGLVNSTQAFRSEDGFIEWGNIAGGITTDGPISQGLLLLPGLDESDLSTVVAMADFSQVDGHIEIINIPEPDTVILAGLAMVGLGIVHRRRRG